MLARRALLLGAGTLPVVAQAQAQPWMPSRSIRLVIPFPPGGVIDLLGRLLAEALPPRLGQNVVVENLPGGGTIVGAQVVRRAAPDGHTWLMPTSTTFAVVPTLHNPPPFDPSRDFTPIALLAATTFALVVRASDGPASLPEFIAKARAAKGATSFGTSGPGTPHHIGFELFKQRAGFEATHVPYRGAAAAVVDLLGGRIDVMIADIPPAIEHIRAGTLRPLAVTNRERLKVLPQVPTLIEQGFPGCEAPGWVGLAGPAGMPPALAQSLSASILAVLREPAWLARVEALALLPDYREQAGFSSYIPEELARWAPVIRASGARAE